MDEDTTQAALHQQELEEREQDWWERAKRLAVELKKLREQTRIKHE